jgi:hypothetical protein
MQDPEELRRVICETLAQMVTHDLAMLHKKAGLETTDMAFTVSLIAIKTLSAVMVQEHDEEKGKAWLEEWLGLVRSAIQLESVDMREILKKRTG